MKYTKSAGEKSTVKVTFNFTEEEWAEATQKAYIKSRGKYSVPGFRKGKAPRPVLENYYGHTVFFEDALNMLYADNYFTVIEKEKDSFTAVGDPEVSIDEIGNGKGVAFTCTIPVKPEVEIEKYTGLKIKKYEYNVTDADVDKEVKKLLERDAQKIEVTDRPCKSGDTVNIDFSGSVDGEKFAGGTAEDYDLVLGSGSFIPGFEEQVEGMEIGSERDITVKFPEDYQADNLRGKDAVFHIVLHKIHESKLPELTDEYVKSHAGVDTVEAYRKKTLDKLTREAEGRSRDETENSIIEEIKKYAKCEIPQAMIENEIDRMVRDFSYRLSYQGIKLEEYIKYMGITMEQFRAQFKDQAQPRVLSQLVIDKIIKTENIKAEESEIDAKLAEQAESVGKTAEEYKKSVDPRQIEYIENDIIITKLFDFLKNNNELYADVEKPATKKTTTAKKTADGDGEPKKAPAKKTTAKKS
ncbi:MAG: trigger factor [Clostridiales bacterium]|nr:trigger factor [Clostridiales bacterium]